MTALKVKLNPTAGLCDGHVAPQTANGLRDNLETWPSGNLWAGKSPGPGGLWLPQSHPMGTSRDLSALTWNLCGWLLQAAGNRVTFGDIKVSIYIFQNTSVKLSRCPCDFPSYYTPKGSGWKSFPIPYCLFILQHNLNQSKARDQETFWHNFSSWSPEPDFTLNQPKGQWWKQVSCCARGSQLGTMTTMCLLEQRMPFV